MHYSPNYLSDLLKKETGKTTQEHIHFQLIEKAKTLLLGTEEPVNRIATSLGFEYPQHFSKLFKSTTGMAPVEYRR
jgi:AraC-like DNA-binding protein